MRRFSFLSTSSTLAASLVLLAAASLGTVACTAKTASPQAPSTQTVTSNLARNTSPTVQPADLGTLVKDNTDFAFSLYAGIATDETSNLFYSPYSISLALAMTYEGAASETAQQMAQALSWELPIDRLGPTFDQLDLTIESRATSGSQPGDVQLTVADSLWGDESLAFQKPFLDALATDFGAGVQVTDIARDPSGAETAINDWVATKTSQNITNLLAPGDITSDTRAVLVNAIYFNAQWASTFDPAFTVPAPFTRLDGSSVQVSEMNQLALSTLCAKGTGYVAVEMPYGGYRTSMLIVLPDAESYATIEKGLSTTFLQGLIASLGDQNVQLGLPKFAVHGATINLSAQLEKLGMTDAFDPGVADFSAMLTSTKLSISKVLHQAQVSVDENGTEASAATASVIAGSIAQQQPPFVVDVNRPFFYFVLDATNTVLFAGRELDPTK